MMNGLEPQVKRKRRILSPEVAASGRPGIQRSIWSQVSAFKIGNPPIPCGPARRKSNTLLIDASGEDSVVGEFTRQPADSTADGGGVGRSTDEPEIDRLVMIRPTGRRDPPVRGGAGW